MGAASSIGGAEELMAETDDVAKLAELFGKLVVMIEASEGCAKFCRPQLEKALPSGGDAELYKERRNALHQLACKYVQIIEGNGGSAPSTVEALVAAQVASGELNLSCADRDDAEQTGCMYAFGLGPISRLPDSVLAIGPALTTLSLKKNELKELPVEFSTLTGLRELDLSENSLAVLPDHICGLVALEKLNISENSLESLPDTIGSLTALTTLIAFKNKIVKLPESIGDCAALEEVNFFNNKLTAVPNSLSGLAGLVDLNLGGNKLKTLPSTMQWAKLERLAISWNNIVFLRDFGGMPALRQLQVNRNQLSEIPDDAFDACTNLEVVDISTNRLERLPASLMLCATLETLDVTSNHLAELPDFSALQALKIVKLSTNKLTDVSSANLSACGAISTLFLNGNDLASLPLDLDRLGALSRMNVSANANLDLSSEEAKALVETLSNRCNANKGRWIA